MAKIVRQVLWYREGRAIVGRAAVENVKVAGTIVLPNDVDIATKIHGDLRVDGVSDVPRKALRNREGNTRIGGTTVGDVRCTYRVILPDDVDVTDEIDEHLWGDGTAHVRAKKNRS